MGLNPFFVQGNDSTGRLRDQLTGFLHFALQVGDYLGFDIERADSNGAQDWPWSG